MNLFLQLKVSDENNSKTESIDLSSFKMQFLSSCYNTQETTQISCANINKSGRPLYIMCPTNCLENCEVEFSSLWLQTKGQDHENPDFLFLISPWVTSINCPRVVCCGSKDIRQESLNGNTLCYI